jgi:AraC-like DNA-binding protein
MRDVIKKMPGNLRIKPSAKTIAPVRYAPPRGYTLDVEVISPEQLRAYNNSSQLGRLERIEFHMLILFTAGRCNHMVDFENIPCSSRSLLALRPGQVHRFDMSTQWQGWLVLFRPEFLQPRVASTPVAELQLMRALQDLPTHLRVTSDECDVLIETITRMHHDARIDSSADVLNALLRNQLQSLLIRLHLLQARTGAIDNVAPTLLDRFRKFRNMLESEFHRQHSVAEYASQLGCSEKSLSRATLELAGVNAKRFVSQRITLEAKRLLSHTSLPIASIADKLGFDEPTNFVKFFRRETESTPGEFRGKDFSSQRRHSRAR